MWLNISSGERGRKEETETCNVCKYSSRSWIAGLRGETRSSRGEEMWFRPQTPVRLVISGRGDAVSSPGTRVPRLDYSKLILNSTNRMRVKGSGAVSSVAAARLKMAKPVKLSQK